jgi:hypothetical protein
MQEEGLPIGLPAKFAFHDRGSYIEIIRRWFGPHIIFLTAFVIFWDGFLVFWYCMAVKSQSLMPLIFPLLHVAVGIGLTYYVIAGYLNKTFIKADYMNISIRHRPVPFFGNKTIKSSDVRQLYSKERISHSRSGTSVSFQVQALTHSGKTVKLLSGLETSEQALYIEQQIERFLNIEDKAVRGEISR